MPIFLPKIPLTIASSPHHSPAATRPQGTAGCLPGSWLLAFGPEPNRALFVLFAEGLDLHIHASGKIQLHQRVHGILRGLKDVDQALVRADLKLLARLLVHVGGAQHAILVFHRRQWNRPRNLRSGTPGGLHDFTRGLIQNAIIVRFQPYANSFFSNHSFVLKDLLRSGRSKSAVAAAWLPFTE